MTNYQAFLVRLWRDDQQQPWRAELVSPHTGEAIRFATAEQMLGYMQEQMVGDTNPPPAPGANLMPQTAKE